MRYLSNKSVLSEGFTLIEMLIVAPLVILLIGTMIGFITSLTGQSLQTTDKNGLSYNVQEALDRIDQDTRDSTGFEITTDVLTSPQGKNNDATAFTSDTALIIDGIVTDSSPLNSTHKPIYYANQPNACGPNQSANKILTKRTIYFVKDGSLWRRTILPAYNTNATPNSDTVCEAPWQHNSCAPSWTANPPCSVDDEEIMQNVDSFTVTYFTSQDESEEVDADAADTATAIKVTINGKKTSAGTPVTATGSMLAAALGNNGGASGGVAASGTMTYTYTGSAQTWTVPTGVTSVKIEAWGAEGGSWGTTPNAGGKGGYSIGNLTVSPGDTLGIYVGGSGSGGTAYAQAPGGWNGGGYAYQFDGSSYGASGGGASGVRQGGTALTNRKIVAGGGGGGGSYAGITYIGGSGGGSSGSNGQSAYSNMYYGGGGGTQSAGGGINAAAGTPGSSASSYNEAGSSGQGGNQTSTSGGWTACAGGGGYYGGGSGGALGAGGGGGSGYIGGVTGGSMTSGNRSGNGQIVLTW